MTSTFKPTPEPVAVSRSLNRKEEEYVLPLGMDHNVPLLPEERMKRLVSQLSEAANITNDFQSTAMRRLGYLHENGLGTEKNPERATELYRQAQILDENRTLGIELE